MLGNVALYIANRAAGGAVGGVARWAAWGAFAVFFIGLALVFAMLAGFWALEPQFGAISAAAIIAGACLLLALLLLMIPAIQDALDRRAEEQARNKAGPIASTVVAAETETKAAVDYFGPLQVVASAFLIGMRAGRKLRPAARAR